MKKYIVYGTSIVTVSKIVEAEDKSAAIKAARENFDGIEYYADRLIGVSGEDEEIIDYGEVEFNNCEEYIEEYE